MSLDSDSAVGSDSCLGFKYERHRPEETLLYQIVNKHYRAFQSLMVAQSNPLPGYVQTEFEEYLKCGLVEEVLPHQPMRQWVLSVPFPLRFLFASYPDIMGKVLRLVYCTVATHLIRKVGFTHKTARIGAVTFIQRFGSALNLNVHFHILFFDGVYADTPHGKTRFQQVNAPTNTELQALLHTISHRIGKLLTHHGLLTQDDENSYLTLEDDIEGEEHTMQQLLGHSITYRVAVGPQQGSKVFTLQALPPDPEYSQVGKVAGFSLHAGVATKANERKKLERICRYIARPAVSEKRLALTQNGMVRYQLKTPYRDGTTYVIFEPLDFIAKLAALIPKPRVNLTCFHGVFAPNSKHRVTITPAKRGKGSNKKEESDNSEELTPMERRTAMTWAQRLKRVFNIDIETCEACGNTVKVIACIEDPIVIKKILDHLKETESSNSSLLPPVSAPPQVSLFE